MQALQIDDRAAAGDPQAQVTLAGRLDAESRHEEAINWLARAARANHAPALRILGVRLLTGDRAPALPAQGAGLIRSAAELGDGEASGLYATALAGGFGVSQHWPAAFDWLLRSAEAGWGPAQRQLILLAGRTGAWQALRAAIDLDDWLTPTPARPLRGDPRIVACDHFVSAGLCRWIIDKARPWLAPAEVYDPATGLPIMGSTRTNRVANLPLAAADPLLLLVHHRLAALAGTPLSHLEAFAILNYRPGEQASEHHDFIDPALPHYAQEFARRGQRIATILLYLNDDYAGGETDFPLLDLRHRGRSGEALMFTSVDPAGRPDHRTLHAGRPPQSGEKWVLSQFVRSRPLV